MSVADEAEHAGAGAAIKAPFAADIDDSPRCPVCLESLTGRSYAIGACDHPTCLECCLRLRSVCERKECPVCRRDLPKVFFLGAERAGATFSSVQSLPLKQDRRLGACFGDRQVEDRCRELLANRCTVCAANKKHQEFRSFAQLDRHVRREHQLFYCDICTESVQSFPSERRLYSRQELAAHKRKGDPDDPSSSGRGHPPCHFCSRRFPDRDAVFAHLRREHFFCHFCDADGKQLFFDLYEDLEGHFKSNHFLCVEGDCRNAKFTNAFRSQIDLKAHMARDHSDLFSKTEARLNSIVDLGLGAASYSGSARAQFDRRRGRSDANSSNITSGTTIDFAVASSEAPPDITDSSFPTLDGSPPPAPRGIPERPAERTEAFPALSSSGSPHTSVSPRPRQTAAAAANSSYLSTRLQAARDRNVTAWQRRQEENFPGLGNVADMTRFRKAQSPPAEQQQQQQLWAQVAIPRQEEEVKRDPRPENTMVTLEREFPGLPVPVQEQETEEEMLTESVSSPEKAKGGKRRKKKTISIKEFLMTSR